MHASQCPRCPQPPGRFLGCPRSVCLLHCSPSLAPPHTLHHEKSLAHQPWHTQGPGGKLAGGRMSSMRQDECTGVVMVLATSCSCCAPQHVALEPRALTCVFADMCVHMATCLHAHVHICTHAEAQMAPPATPSPFAPPAAVFPPSLRTHKHTQTQGYTIRMRSASLCRHPPTYHHVRAHTNIHTHALPRRSLGHVHVRALSCSYRPCLVRMRPGGDGAASA